MALLLAEPFSHYLSGTNTQEPDAVNDNSPAGTTVWAADNGQTNNTQGRFGAQVMSYNTGGRRLFMRPPAAPSTTVFMGAAIKLDTNGGTYTSGEVFGVLNSALSGYHWHLQMAASGNLYVFAAPSASVPIAVIPCPFSPNVWHWIEAKSLIDNSAGTIEIRVDGVTVYSGTGLDTQTGGTTVIGAFGIGGVANNLYWEDFIAFDNTGATFNDWIGDLRYEIQIPDADGATANWTPSASTNVSCIDDPLGVHDSDTTYISSSTTDQDNYASHAAVSATGNLAILFVELMALARSDTTGDKIAMLVDSGGTVNAGVDQDLVSGAYRWRKKFWETDPNTSSAWTVSNINAAEFGVRKRV